MTPAESRTTNRIHEYQQRRAAALDHQEHKHDVLIETRLKTQHGQHATGYKALLVRRTLSALATRTANAGGAVMPPNWRDT